MSPPDWRPMLATVLGEVWPDAEAAWSTRPEAIAWLAAQVAVESGGNPRAESASGARGLLQLMPATAMELGVRDPWDPVENLRGGVTYLRRQFAHLEQVPSSDERIRWAAAAYTGGRAYVTRAFTLARLDGERRWWMWTPGRYWLFHRACLVQGRGPDYLAIWQYIARIEEHAARIRAGE